MEKCIIFSIDDQTYAMELCYIDSVVPAAELIPFQAGSKSVLGLLNLHGVMIPVINTRVVLGLPIRDLEISDQFIICKYEKQKFALSTDHTIELRDLSPYLENAEQDNYDFLSCIQYAINCEDRVIFLLRPEAFTSLTHALQSGG
jgi:purine-binding chemotaxis protein CheW